MDADRLQRKKLARRRRESNPEPTLTPGRERAVVIAGDSAEVLPRLPDNSVHGVVTDPPAAISFMGREWDNDKGGRARWVAWLANIMSQSLRVAMPGSYGAVWALPRTSHWTGCALEDAGYEIIDIVHHIFGQGMAKGFLKDATPEMEGYQTRIKPAAEHWWIIRKPLSESSVRANMERWGTGAMHVDAARVGTNAGWSYPKGKGGSPCHGGGFKDIPCEATKGRDPPNLVFTHSPGCVRVGTTRVKTGTAVRRNGKGGKFFGGIDPDSRDKLGGPAPDFTHASADGTEEMATFQCQDGCPVATLGDKARFFPVFEWEDPAPYIYLPKPRPTEKDAGCEGMDPRDWREGTKNSTPRSGQFFEQVGRKGAPRANNHPTVKSVTLMRWLVKLLVPPSGVVLDPFNGSGTTGVAAIHEGMSYVGIEGDEDAERRAYFCEVTRRRIAHAQGAAS